MASQIHQVSRILTVMNGESGIKTNAAGVFTQEACTDAVKGAGPGETGTDQAGVPG